MPVSSTAIFQSWDGLSTIAQYHANGEWNQGGAGSGFSIDAAGYTGQALLSGNTTNTVYRTIGTLMNGYRAGFRLYVPSVAGSGIIFIHKGTSAGFIHGGFFRSGATLAWSPQGGGSLVTPNVLTSGTWHQIEVRFIAGNPSGFMEIRVERIVAASGTRNTTQFVTINSTAQWAFGAQRSDFTGGNSPCDSGMKMDDFYLVADADGYQGAIRIGAIRPDGNGNYSQFVGSDGNSVDNYLHVDEQSTDDADYVESTLDGDTDTYTHSAITVYPASTLIALQQVARAAWIGGSARKLRFVQRRAGVDAVSSDAALSNSLQAHRTIITTDPAGGSFDFTNADATEFGYEQRP